MFHLACTRFTNDTYQENKNYRENHNEVVIYGAGLKIRDTYSSDILLFVAEMNNTTNKIEGIGLIKNMLVCDKKYRIYENSEYNRYIYRGKHWVSRSQINDFDSEINDIFDIILFKGKSHLKCRTGITVITDRLFVHWNYDLKSLKEKVRQLFVHYFDEQTNKMLNEENNNAEIEYCDKNIEK